MAAGPASSKRAVGSARFELPWGPVSFVVDKVYRPWMEGLAGSAATVGLEPPNRSQTGLVGQVDFVPMKVEPFIGRDLQYLQFHAVEQYSAPAFVVATMVESKSISVATTQARSSGHHICGVNPSVCQESGARG